MSSTYTTTERGTRTTAEHPQLVVVGRDGAPRPQSTPYHSPERTGHTLAPTTRSATGQSQVGHLGTHLTQARRRAERPPPPPLLPIKTIPLPALADSPISVHPLLSYTPSKVVLEYDLSMPSSNARLRPTTKAHHSRRDWRRQPAMNTSMVGSITIRVPDLERLVVAFPTTLDSSVVTVGDVLDVVYRALRESVIEQYGGAAEGQGNSPTLGQIRVDRPWWTVDEYVAMAIQKQVGGSHWWAGLYSCPKEQDVWVLRTRRGVRR